MADQPWLTGSPERLRPALEACGAGAPPNVVLLRLAMAAEAADEVEAAVVGALDAASREAGTAEVAGRLREALRLWRRTPQAFATVKAVLDGVEHQGAANGPEEGLDYWARSFDRLAGVAPDGGVALYALGDPDLLRAATGEVVDWLAGQGLLGTERRVLEIGCGNGRFVAALAPKVAQLTGLDISAGMIARARERCAGLANVVLEVGSGRGLERVGDGTVDLVLAADVFPYLVQVGEAVAERHVAEAARVLRPGGHLAILNYSYRGDRVLDRADVSRLALRWGLEVRRVGLGDFALWDAQSFLLRKG